MITDNYIRNMKMFQCFIAIVTIFTLALAIRAFNTGNIFTGILMVLTACSYTYSFTQNMNFIRTEERIKKRFSNILFLGKDYGKM